MKCMTCSGVEILSGVLLNDVYVKQRRRNYHIYVFKRK